jgi:hypothetical protein
MDIQDDSYFSYDYTHSRKAKMMAIGVILDGPDGLISVREEYV